MDLPEGYSFIEIDGQLIRNENDALLVLRESDQTQHWIHPEDTESSNVSRSQSQGYADSTAEEHSYEYVDEDETQDHDNEFEELISESEMICDSSKGDKRKEWTDPETLLLIDSVRKYKSELNDPKIKKKTLFDSISNDMNITSNGKCVTTIAQCENKWMSLVKKYKDIKDHNNRTGNERRTWKYFQLITEIIGDQPNIVPTASCSSLQLGNSNLHKQLQEKLKDKQKKPPDSPEGAKKKTPKKGGSRLELLTFLKTHENKTEQREREKMEMLKNQHEDLKSFMKQILTKLDGKQDDNES